MVELVMYQIGGDDDGLSDALISDKEFSALPTLTLQQSVREYANLLVRGERFTETDEHAAAGAGMFHQLVHDARVVGADIMGLTNAIDFAKQELRAGRPLPYRQVHQDEVFVPRG